MKTKTLLKNPIFSVLISLILVFSFVAIAVTAEPVNAIATDVTITDPLEADPAYAKPDGEVTITFDVDVSTTGMADITLQILESGTTTVVSSRDVQYNFTNNETGLNWGVTLNDLAVGEYDVRVRVRQPAGTGTWVNSAIESSAVIVVDTPPDVTLIAPNGGEYISSTADYTIRWNATDNIPGTDTVTVSANYSVDGGTTYPSPAFAAAPFTEGVNSAVWPHANIPDIDYQTGRLELTVTDAAGNDTVVTSASNFYIIDTAPTVTVSIPNASSSWNGGSTQTIAFTTTSAFILNVDYKLEFFDGADWSDITSGTDGWVLNQPVGLTTYSWTVDNTCRGADKKIRASVRDKVGTVTGPVESAAFTIRDVTKPTVSITAPEAGDKVYNGIATTIDWTANDNVAGENLTYYWYLSTDGGATWAALGNETSAQGDKSKPWTPATDEIKPNCKIKVTARDGATTPNTEEAISNTFSMLPSGVAPTVSLVSPLGGETWQGGTCRTINWTATDPNDATGELNYTLQYTDNGTDWADIAVLVDRFQGTNTFCWAVPLTATTDYQVRVTAASPGGGNATDTSDTFTVTGATAGVQEATLTLKAGWNLVSLQLMPVVYPSTTDPNTYSCCSYPIESVLADCLDNIEGVWYWPEGVGTDWLSWKPGVPSLLTAMTDGKAYWVNMAADDTATYLGRKGPGGGEIPTTPYQYYVGWNQVGFKSTAVQQVQNYLGGTPGTTYIIPIYGWNADTQEWTMPIATDNMTPGQGYWVYFNVNHIINAGAY
jgi:hypothetical protein